MAPPIRILYLVDNLTVGGQQHRVLNEIEYLSTSFMPYLGYLTDGPFRARAERACVEIDQIAEPFPANSFSGIVGYLRAIVRIYILLKLWNIEIVHSGHMRLYLAGTIACMLRGVPIVRLPGVLMQQNERRLQKWFRFLPFPYLTSRFICGAQANVQDLRDAGIRLSKLFLLPMPTNLIDFSPDINDRSIRMELGIPDDAPIVGTMTRLANDRGVDVLIHSMPSVLSGFPDAHCLVIGDGEERTELERLAGEIGVTDRVHFLGNRIGDTAPLYRSMDVFAIIFRNNLGGLAIREAMACGIPVICSQVGGAQEEYVPNGTGVLIDETDFDVHLRLAEAIKMFFSDHEKARQMGMRGRAFVEERFDVKKLHQQLENLYIELVNENRGRE